MIVHTVVSFMHPATTQKVVYGAKSEVAAAAGLNGTLPDVFTEYYQKSGVEMRQAEGGATRRILFSSSTFQPFSLLMLILAGSLSHKHH